MDGRIAGAATLLTTSLAMACGDGDVTGPTLERRAVAGVYEVTTLTFDPIGPAVGPIELVHRFGAKIRPALIVTAGDSVEFTFAAPRTGLIAAASGNYAPTASGIRITFRSNQPGQATLVPQRLTLVFTAGDPATLSFRGPVLGGGIDRDVLLLFVPELANKPLLQDPIPGDLTLVLTRRVQFVAAACEGTGSAGPRAERTRTVSGPSAPQPPTPPAGSTRRSV